MKIQDNAITITICILITMLLVFPIFASQNPIEITSEQQDVDLLKTGNSLASLPNPGDVDFINLRSIAYNPGVDGSYSDENLSPHRVRADMEYIKSLGFNAIKLWADPAQDFWQNQLDGFLDITDEVGIYVLIASIPETSVLGWGDEFSGTTPDAADLVDMAAVAESHESVLAHCIHLNDLAIEDGANDALNWQWDHSIGWESDPYARADFTTYESYYYQESLLKIEPEPGTGYDYGWIKRTIPLELSTYDHVTIRIQSLSAGAKWALKVKDITDDTLYTLQYDCTNDGIFQYEIPSPSSDVHWVELQLYAIDGAVNVDWLWVSEGLVNMIGSNDAYRTYYRDLASDIRSSDSNHPVYFFNHKDPKFDWVPVQEDYWGTDLQVEAFGLQPYTQATTDPLFPHHTFHEDTFKQYFRYFGLSNKPLYVDEWGVKDSTLLIQKDVEIEKFLEYMETRAFEDDLDYGEQVFGWSYFILDNPGDGTYGIRDIIKDPCKKNRWVELLYYLGLSTTCLGYCKWYFGVRGWISSYRI